MPFNASSTWRPKPEVGDLAELGAELEATSAAVELAKRVLAEVEAVNPLDGGTPIAASVYKSEE